VNIHCIKNFFTVHGLWATCACPEKTELPWNVSLYWIYFLYSGFLSNLRLPCKQFALKNFTILNILHIQDFWATLRLPWKTELPLIHCMEFIFYIQDIWATCACPENSVRPEIFHSTEYSFYIQDFWATCACPEKQSVLWDCSLYWICFLHSGFLGNMFSLVSLIHRFVFLLATTRVVCEAPISTSLRRGSTEHEVGQAAIFLVFGMTPRVILLVLVVRAQPTWTTSSRSSHLNVFASMTMLYYAFLMTKLT